jgi:dipeptidyl aminopeptidase/acylaminoacyl peptidase
MKKEQIDREVAELLATARPKMSDDWQARAQAAVGTARPRRSRRLTALIAGLAVLLLAGGALATGIFWLPDEGTLYFSGAEETPLTGIVTHKIRHVLRPGGISIGEAPSADADLSPSGEEWVYGAMYDWPPAEEHIWRTRKDGAPLSNPSAGGGTVDFLDPFLNVSAAAGLGGVNCGPQWSPDGTMISFKHADPQPGELPCEAGFHAWVMYPDGSEAHPLIAGGGPTSWEPTWSPDGRHLLVATYVRGQTLGEPIMLVDLEGADLGMLPNVGDGARFSPDGTEIISSAAERGELDGWPGVWRQLLLTDADGSNPEVLLQQFVVDAEVEAVHPTEEELAAIPDYDWVQWARDWAGPVSPVWSPRGDKIAFLAALPYDPSGPYHRQQVDVWIYDLNTDEVIQVTNDDLGQYSLLWEP